MNLDIVCSLKSLDVLIVKCCKRCRICDERKQVENIRCHINYVHFCLKGGRSLDLVRITRDYMWHFRYL